MKTHFSIAAALVLLVGCSADEVNNRGSASDSKAQLEEGTETSFELSSNSQAAMRNNQDAQAVLNRLQGKLLGAVRQGSGTQPKFSRAGDPVALLNKNARTNIKAGSTQSLSLAKSTSQTLTAEAFCSMYYSPSTSQYSLCVTNFKAYFPQGIFIGTVDFDLPAITSAVFPLVVPGVGSGMCVYARISVLAVGIACGNASGGVWAGCDVWYGCGSGSL